MWACIGCKTLCGHALVIRPRLGRLAVRPCVGMYKTLLLCVHAWFMGWSCITAQRSQGLLGDEVCSVYFGRGSMADEATAFRVFLSRVRILAACCSVCIFGQRRWRLSSTGTSSLWMSASLYWLPTMSRSWRISARFPIRSRSHLWMESQGARR